MLWNDLHNLLKAVTTLGCDGPKFKLWKEFAEGQFLQSLIIKECEEHLKHLPCFCDISPKEVTSAKMKVEMVKAKENSEDKGKSTNCSWEEPKL